MPINNRVKSAKLYQLIGRVMLVVSGILIAIIVTIAAINHITFFRLVLRVAFASLLGVLGGAVEQGGEKIDY